MMTITHTAAAAAAALLVARRLDGTAAERLVDNCRPASLEDGLAIQAAVTAAWCTQMDDSIGAWKCLLPSPERLVVAPIFTRTIDSVSPVAVWPKAELARIEPELAFFMGSDLPARAQPYSELEIDAAIVRTHMALELIGSRYAEPGQCEFPEMLADSLVNQGLFIGPQVDSNAARAASGFTIAVSAQGETSLHQGTHPNIHPRAPLYWLVEFLRSRGQGLVAGQAVITGSFAGVIAVPLNTDIVIHYAGLGELQVRFNARKGF